MKIKFGPAGLGSCNPGVIKSLKKLGLSAAELSFTYGVRMSNDLAKVIGLQAKKSKVFLSVHAPYYINLASIEHNKIIESMKRILESCERAHYLGAKYVVFHPGFYQAREKEVVYEEILDSVEKMQSVIEERGWNVELAPETTGKKTQFGDLGELLRLRKETGCHICIDFAHILARTGCRNYEDILLKLANLGYLHAHFTGIEYTEAGEKRHALTPENEIKEFLVFIKKLGIDTTIINESPDPIQDSLKTGILLKRMNIRS